MDYLYDKQFYIDRYDLSTIRECRDMIEVCKSAYVKGKEDSIAQGPNGKGELAKATNWMTNQLLFQIIAERFRHKEEMIEKWMLEAKLKQDKFDLTQEPANVNCPDCNTVMIVGTKTLVTSEDKLRMMYLFECPTCKKRHWIYEDGQERVSQPTLCSKCNCEANVSVVKESKDKIIWKTTCLTCRHMETHIDDFEKDRLERENREKEEKKLLEMYREQFCSEKSGKEALDYIDGLPVADEVFREQIQKYDSKAYHNVVNLRKLTITELEKILITFFQKERYRNLVLGQPEISQHVIVSFTIQDADPTRRLQTDIHDLKKALKNELESTNWRLMTDSLSSRLGYVTGRLKGYESEEDFFEITGPMPEKNEPKVNSELRSKYEHTSVVQLAKISGEFQGKENARKRRLQHEPDGFLLDEDHILTCGLCGEHHSGIEIWWNLDGLRCDDCHRNIIEKMIPDLGTRDNKDNVYFSDWQLSSESHFGIHPATARKLRRQGLLLGHDLTRKDGQAYYTVYLYSENAEFLKKYPKKEKNRMIITDLLGDQVAI